MDHRQVVLLVQPFPGTVGTSVIDNDDGRQGFVLPQAIHTAFEQFQPVIGNNYSYDFHCASG